VDRRTDAVQTQSQPQGLQRSSWVHSGSPMATHSNYGYSS
jgi:hypothetical protein